MVEQELLYRWSQFASCSECPQGSPAKPMAMAVAGGKAVPGSAFAAAGTIYCLSWSPPCNSS